MAPREEVVSRINAMEVFDATESCLIDRRGPLTIANVTRGLVPVHRRSRQVDDLFGVGHMDNTSAPKGFPATDARAEVLLAATWAAMRP